MNKDFIAKMRAVAFLLRGPAYDNTVRTGSLLLENACETIEQQENETTKKGEIKNDTRIYPR